MGTHRARCCCNDACSLILDYSLKLAAVRVAACSGFMGLQLEGDIVPLNFPGESPYFASITPPLQALHCLG
jgi:hypothetical protein